MSTSPPSPPTPFDIPEFATLWTSIYHHHEAIGSISPSWISYPPHTSPPLNAALCHELALDSKLIDLLALLPYPVDDDASSSFAFLPRTQAHPFLEEGVIRSARDPWMDYMGGGGGGERLEKWEVALTGAQRYGWLLILDVRAGREDFAFLVLLSSNELSFSRVFTVEQWIILSYVLRGLLQASTFSGAIYQDRFVTHVGD